MYQIMLEIQRLPEGPYLATSLELPGLIIQGASPEEVVYLAPAVARDPIDVMIETGQDLPPGLLHIDVPARVPIVIVAKSGISPQNRVRPLGL